MRQIKDKTTTSCDFFEETIAWSIAMSRNVGTIDQYVRIVVGLALVAFAFQEAFLSRDGTGLDWLASCSF